MISSEIFHFLIIVFWTVPVILQQTFCFVTGIFPYFIVYFFIYICIFPADRRTRYPHFHFLSSLLSAEFLTGIFFCSFFQAINGKKKPWIRHNNPPDSKLLIISYFFWLIFFCDTINPSRINRAPVTDTNVIFSCSITTDSTTVTTHDTPCHIRTGIRNNIP